MKTYQFRTETPEAQRDALVLALRKDGYRASRETDALRTDASLTAVGLVTPGGAAGVIDIAPLIREAREAARYDDPHADASGQSRRIVIASCLAGKDSGEVAMHLTPAEEREYNAGMARLAELG